MTEAGATPGDGPVLLDGRDRIAAAALVLFPALLYGAVLSQWWTGDDTQILKLALSRSLGEIFTAPPAWRELSWLYFTPMSAFSYRLDAALFGLDPRLWYLEHLLVTGAAGALLYLLLRAYRPRFASLAGAILFLASPPLAETSRQLWSRHYAEGLALALAALLIFRRAVRRESHSMAFAAAVAGLLAMLCKEVFAPLPLVALLLPAGSFGRRVRLAAPLFVVLAVYLGWRQAMVGYWGGDGGGWPGLREPARGAARILGGLPEALLGIPPAAGLGLLVLALVLLRPSAGEAARLAVGAGLVLAPLGLLKDPFAGRYALVPLAAIAALFGAALGSGLRGGTVRRALSILLLAGVVVPAARRSSRNFALAAPTAARCRAEGRFFFERSAPGDVLVRPADAAWYFEGLEWLRDREGRGRPGGVLYDEVALCGEPAPSRLFEYVAETGSVVASPPALAERVAETCRRVDATLPLTVKLRYERSVLSWNLGPQVTGSWAFLSGESAARYDVPAEGRLTIRLSGVARIRVRYESPDGRIAVSPLLELREAREAAEAHYARP